MKGTITFVRYCSYTVEGADEEEIFEKAHDAFKADQQRFGDSSHYDDYEEEYYYPDN